MIFLHRFFLQGLYGEGNAQVGLSRSSWSHGECHVVLVERVDESLLVLRPAFDGPSAYAINQYALDAIGLCGLSFYDVEDIFVVDGVVFHHVSAHGFEIHLHLGHLVLVAQHANHVVASYDAQFGVERLNHLEVTIVDAVKHNGVDVLKYYMFLCQYLSSFCCV